MSFFQRSTPQVQMDFQQNIAADLVRLLYSQARIVIIGALLIGTTMLGVLYSVVPHAMLLTWYVSVLVIIALRYTLVKFYFYKNPTPEKSLIWQQAFVFITALAGICWAFAGILLIPANSVYETFVICALAGVTASAVPFLSADCSASRAFIIPILLPFGLWQLVQGNSSHQLLGLMALFYLGLLEFTCAKMHAVIREGLRLKYENATLVNDVIDMQQEVAGINLELQTEMNKRKEIATLLQTSEDQYRLLTDALPTLVSYIDMDMRYQFVNKAYADWFGLTSAEIVDEPVKNLLGHTAYLLFEENIIKLYTRKTVTYETIMRSAADTERYVSVTLVPNIKAGEIQGVFTLISDITPQINYLSTHDTLTDLPNRSLFTAKFSYALNSAKTNKTKLALLLINIDNFKSINDNSGRDVGDYLLLKAVERIQDTLRDTDMLARLSGDEFIITLEGISIDDVIDIAAKIRGVFVPPFLIDGAEIYITLSMGVSIFPDDGNQMSMLLKNADIALRRAKQQGRDSLQFYTESMQDNALNKSFIKRDLAYALSNNELAIYYQPVMDVCSNSITSMEALLRWHHPTRVISPVEFIPVAEESGLIEPIGAWVLRSVCEQSLLWQQSANVPLQLRISINVSARQFRAANFIAQVEDTLRTTGLSGEFITIELTEKLIMEDYDYSIQVVRALKHLGLLISIDDFGTGYSSLSYLRRFPIDILKIDKSFIADMIGVTQQSEDNAVIVTAMIAMAHSLGMKVIAEGVETMAQYAFLKEQGCDEIQGYLLSPPLPALEIATFLQNAFSVEEYLKSQHV